MTQGFDNRDDRDDGFRCAGCLVAVADDVNSREGAHTVVYTHDAFCIIGNQGETVLYRMEARLTAVG